MKNILFLAALLMCTTGFVLGQNDKTDSSQIIKLDEVIISANRIPVSLKKNPGAMSLVTPQMLSIGAVSLIVFIFIFSIMMIL